MPYARNYPMLHNAMRRHQYQMPGNTQVRGNFSLSLTNGRTHFWYIGENEKYRPAGVGFAIGLHHYTGTPTGVTWMEAALYKTKTFTNTSIPVLTRVAFMDVSGLYDAGSVGWTPGIWFTLDDNIDVGDHLFFAWGCQQSGTFATISRSGEQPNFEFLYTTGRPSVFGSPHTPDVRDTTNGMPVLWNYKL